MARLTLHCQIRVRLAGRELPARYILQCGPSWYAQTKTEVHIYVHIFPTKKRYVFLIRIILFGLIWPFIFVWVLLMNHLHIIECILTINHHHLYSIDYCLSCDHPSKSSICILVTVPTPVYKYTTVQEVFCAKPRPFYSPTYTSLC